jgi:hypothetical protein
MMNEMKTKYGQTYDQCVSLAPSRGYRLGDNEGARPVKMSSRVESWAGSADASLLPFGPRPVRADA